MNIIHNASSKVERNANIVARTLANAEALAKDAAWQATLASMPKGVMHS